MKKRRTLDDEEEESAAESVNSNCMSKAYYHTEPLEPCHCPYFVPGDVDHNCVVKQNLLHHIV